MSGAHSGGEKIIYCLAPLISERLLLFILTDLLIRLP